MSSTNSVHYAIRPNKAVERKLIFHVIDMMRDIFNFSTYRYVGFGAISFVDFIYAHKHLRISKLISIEEDFNTYKRALANRPYACIDVLYGDSSSVIPTIGVAEFKTIYWLDYDSGPVGPVINDAKWVLQRAPEGTILILTINAHSGSLIPRNTPRENAIEEKIKSFRRVFGDAAPLDIKNKDVQDEKLRYVTMLSASILDTLAETTRKHGRSEHVQTIFNIHYNDGAPMLTVGVMLLNADNIQAIAGVEDEISTMVRDRSPYVLAIPPLTHREKNAIDRLLPDSVGPAQTSLEEAGVHISGAQLSAYKKLYRFYPTFSEVIF